MAQVVILFRDGSERVVTGEITLSPVYTESGALTEYVIAGNGFRLRVPASSVSSVEESREWAAAT